MTIWFTADEHYDHPAILALEKRPFDSLTSMEQWLVGNHNDVVAPADTTYHLGDFCFSPKVERLALLLSKLNGQHVLVAGNHDRCSDVHKRWQRGERMCRIAGFTDVLQLVALDVLGIGNVLISHFPAIETVRSGDDQRYLNHRPTMDGHDAQFCGHSHGRWRRSNKSVNVGVDVWGYRPVALEKLVWFWQHTLDLG